MVLKVVIGMEGTCSNKSDNPKRGATTPFSKEVFRLLKVKMQEGKVSENEMTKIRKNAECLAEFSPATFDHIHGTGRRGQETSTKLQAADFAMLLT